MSVLLRLRRHRYAVYVRNLLAGACLPLAFAPFAIYPLALLCLGVLFWSLLPGKAASRFGAGYWFGAGLFCAGVPWVYVSMHDFGGLTLPAAAGLTLLFALFLALYPALAAASARFWQHLPRPWLLLAVFPALWVLMEWIKGWLFTGFPWLNLGYSQIDAPLKGYAPIFGVYGVSWLLAVSTGLLVLAVSERRNRSTWRVLLPVLAGLWIAGAALEYVPWTAAKPRSLTVTLVQGNIHQDLKWRPEQRQPTIETYVTMTAQHWDSDLVIWPETAMPFYFHQGVNFFPALAARAQETGTDILLGIPVLEQETGRYFNSMVSIGGAPAQFYHKRHLVPFGEYVPLQLVLGSILDFMQIPMSDFSSSTTPPQTMLLAGEPMAVGICYEDAFGEEVIDYLPAAGVLVNASNDAWFGHSVAPHQHLQIARMRALETGRPLLRATNTGVTAFIDYRGKVAEALDQFVSDSLTGTVQPRSGSTPYAVWGNIPVVLLAVASLLAAHWRGRRS